MPARFYSSSASATTLSVGITAAQTSIQVGSITGFPIQYPYSLILDGGTASEEVVTVTAGSGTTLTATRGSDGTVALDHAAGATVEHGVSARDFAEPQAHMDSTSGAHGTTSALVGVSDNQTLTNKTINGTSNTFQNIPQASVSGLVAQLATLTSADTTETNTRVAQGATLQANIDAEATNRINADATEVTNRTNADNALSARVTALEATPSWVTAGFTGHSGWTINTARYLKQGVVVYLQMTATRTGADINNGGTNENITDTDVLDVIPAAARPVTNDIYGDYSKDTSAQGECAVTTSGVLTLTTLSNGATITSGDSIRVRISYPVV